MSKSENRHYTKVWKKKRKNKSGDRCHNAQCGICSYHKRFSLPNKHTRTQNEKDKEEFL